MNLPPSDRLEPLSATESRHYRMLVNAVTDCAIYGLDPQGRVTDWNPGAERIKGYRPNEIIGRHFSQFYTPEDQARGEPARALETARRTGRFQGEGWRVRKDGSRFWAEVVVEDVLDDDRKLIGFVKVTRDATQRRNAQMALQQAAAQAATAQLALQQAEAHLLRAADQRALARSEAEFRAIFNSAGQGIVRGDPLTSTVTMVNRAFADMLGYTPEALVGQPGLDLIWPEDRDRHVRERGPLKPGVSREQARDVRFLRRDGSAVWARSTVTLVAAGGAIAAPFTVAVIENIDAARKATLALEQTAREVEQVLNDRTLALSQRDLLLQEVYHRVKNNLQTVDSLLVLQSRQLDDPRAKVALANLRSRVYALGLVHNQLMASADLRTFDIAPFLRELSANLIDGAATGGAVLAVHATPLAVGLDFAVPMALLATELVSNSLKHAFPDGGGRIEVRLDRNDAGGLTFVVADNGRGFDAVTDDPAAPRPGLGHQIVRNLVRQLKGTLVMETSGGARVEITMPGPAPT